MKIEKSDLKELYEKLYFHEIDMREKLEGRLKLPFGLFVIVSGVLGIIFQKKEVFFIEHAKFVIGILVLLSLIFFAVAAFFFVKSWQGYTYKLLPTPLDIDNYVRTTEAHYKALDPDEHEIWTKEAMGEYLHNTFRDYSSWNMQNNDTKSKNLTLTNIYLTLSFAFSILSLFPYYVANIYSFIVK